ncbi:unnamed protein product [Urochloa decumbens]|uniref:Uncharacterized protein n=1 Tax=Urochloa decumbens TaxID=240449 RepID=A0ABC8XK72_9POAL
MEQKLLPVVVLLVLGILCAAGPGHALRLLNEVDGGREFSFGSKAAGPAETEPLDPSLSDDYENEISHVEFEPELGSATPYAAAAAAPVPAVATTATITIAAAAAAAGPAQEPVKARNAAAVAAAEAAGTRSMKWWLPPSTMPSFPLFPTPGGGMPGIPGLPMPGMPFRPIGGGWGAVPAPPDQAPPAPPAGAASTNANDPDIANGGGIN